MLDTMNTMALGLRPLLVVAAFAAAAAAQAQDTFVSGAAAPASSDTGAVPASKSTTAATVVPDGPADAPASASTPKGIAPHAAYTNAETDEPAAAPKTQKIGKVTAQKESASHSRSRSSSSASSSRGENVGFRGSVVASIMQGNRHALAVQIPNSGREIVVLGKKATREKVWNVLPGTRVSVEGYRRRDSDGTWVIEATSIEASLNSPRYVPPSSSSRQYGVGSYTPPHGSYIPPHGSYVPPQPLFPRETMGPYVGPPPIIVVPQNGLGDPYYGRGY